MNESINQSINLQNMSEMVAGEYSGKLENLLGANREFSLTHTPAHHHHYIVT